MSFFYLSLIIVIYHFLYLYCIISCILLILPILIVTLITRYITIYSFFVDNKLIAIDGKQWETFNQPCWWDLLFMFNTNQMRRLEINVIINELYYSELWLYIQLWYNKIYQISIFSYIVNSPLYKKWTIQRIYYHK